MDYITQVMENQLSKDDREILSKARSILENLKRKKGLTFTKRFLDNLLNNKIKNG